MEARGDTIAAPETVADETPAAASAATAIRFDAVLFPRPSLSPRSFFLLMAVLCLVSFMAGIIYMLAGTGPVIGFFAVDIALVYAAFRITYRSARIYETVRLTDEHLAVERINPGRKRQRWEFQTYWLRVEIDDQPGPESALTLTTHGNSLEIGAFLMADEKIDLARSLRTELDRLRGHTI